MSDQKNYYPLSQSQLMMFYNLKYSFKKSVVNICTMMHFEAEMDMDLLGQAVVLSMMRNRAASIRLRRIKETDSAGKKRTVIKQYFSGKLPEGIEKYHFATQEAMDQAVERWNTAPFPNGAMDTQMYRVAMVIKPDGHAAVYFCVNHVVFDAYSLMATAGDLLRIYAALHGGGPIPPPLPSPIPAYEADWAYPDSGQHTKDHEFWKNETFAEEPQFTSLNGLDSRDHIRGKKYGVTLRLWEVKASHLNLPIPADLVERVDTYAQERRIPPQILYLLAMRNFLSKENGREEDVIIGNTVARRATKAQKGAGGTFVHAIPFRSRIPNETSFEEACEEMKRLQSRYYRHANMPIMEILDIMKKNFALPECRGYMTVTITYQPYSVEGDDDSMLVHFERLGNGAATQPVYLTIMALDDSGDLNCNYEYIEKHTTPERLIEYHSYMMRMLRRAVKEPGLTLAQLMEE